MSNQTFAKTRSRFSNQESTAQTETAGHLSGNIIENSESAFTKISPKMESNIKSPSFCNSSKNATEVTSLGKYKLERHNLLGI